MLSKAPAAAAVIIIGIVWNLVGVAQAGPIASRAALQALLGSTVVENFKTFNLPNGAAQILSGCTGAFDSTSLCSGQGPGLVRSGFSIGTIADVPLVPPPRPPRPQFRTPLFQIDGANFLGAPSREFLVGNGSMIVDFDLPTRGFGVDVRDFLGRGQTVTMRIFGADDATLLAAVPLILPSTGVPVFFGWEDVGGIGRFDILRGNQLWSGIIDNLEFAGPPRPAPEPSTLAVLIAGVAGLAVLRRARRR